MKALSIMQPWANLIASGKKTLEIRTWRSAYRGPLLICTGQRPMTDADGLGPSVEVSRMIRSMPTMPLGCTIAIVDMVDCRPMTLVDETLALCRYYPQEEVFGQRLWAHVYANARPMRNFPLKGFMRMFDVDDAQVNEWVDGILEG